MTPKITAEQREALSRGDGPVLVEDEETRRIYFLVDPSTLETLQRQEDLAAIREGIADMEAGHAAPVAEVVNRIRSKLGLTNL
jgi:predicted transcriptional regulator